MVIVKNISSIICYSLEQDQIFKLRVFNLDNLELLYTIKLSNLDYGPSIKINNKIISCSQENGDGVVIDLIDKSLNKLVGL
jgi:hypothetical protein